MRKTLELAKAEFMRSGTFEERAIGVYLIGSGHYKVREYLPAGEVLPVETVYAYDGPSIEAAREAYRKVRRSWMDGGWRMVSELGVRA